MDTEITNFDVTELIRSKPEVIFLSDGLEGSIRAVRELLNIFLTEAVMGCCKKIDVKISQDDSIEIRSLDRGLVINESDFNGKPSWFYTFCKPSSGPREAEEYISFLKGEHSRLYGEVDELSTKYEVDEFPSFELCCVQCTSEFMTVEAVRDGVKKSLHFKGGYSVGDIEKTDITEPASTKIHFKPDSAVFKDVKIPAAVIADILRDAVITIPGLNCTFEDERIGLKDAYCFENGIVDHACDIAGNSMHTPFFVKEIETTGKDRYDQLSYDARVKVALAFSDSISHISCFHNYHTLKFGGDHLKVAQEKILQTLQWYFNEDKELADISFDRIKDKMILLIESNCSRCATEWLNAQKTYISNIMIKDMTSDLFEEDFSYYVNKNADLIRSILTD